MVAKRGKRSALRCGLVDMRAKEFESETDTAVEQERYGIQSKREEQQYDATCNQYSARFISPGVTYTLAPLTDSILKQLHNSRRRGELTRNLQSILSKMYFTKLIWLTS